MSAPSQQASLKTGIRLDSLLESMAAPQLIRIAARYAPGQEARQIVKARQTVARALDDPATLAALVESLTPLERFVLGEVRRSPQGVSGWALLAGARLRDLKPERRPQAVELYRHYRPASFEGAELIWPLLASGLLLPLTLPNPFVESYGRGIGAGSPLLSADERVLLALPADLARPAQVLSLPAGTQPAQATPPSLIHLHLFEVLRAVSAEGGLPLTRAGDLNRAGLKRVQKRLPALEDQDELEWWLNVAQLSGLLSASETVLAPTPAAERFAQQNAAGWLPRLAAVYPHLLEAGDPGNDSANLAHPEALRSALIGLLTQLEGPTTLSGLETALETLTPADLRQPSWRGKQVAWRGWLRGTVRGTLRRLGLVALSAQNGDDQTVAAAPALLGHQGPVPSGPAWVVQPNFELVVYPAQLRPEHLEVLRATQATRFDAYSASYRLTRESVYEALEAGLGLEALLDGLETGSAVALPAGVRSTLRGWAARRERLVLHTGVTLLEFPDARGRDDHRAQYGGTAIGDALLLPAAGRKIATTLPTLRYDGPPARVLSAAPSGLLKVNGELDFLGRALLAQYAQPERGGYTLRPPAPGACVPATLLRELEARVRGHLPALLRLQLDAWSGTRPPPALQTVTLLQHPQASALLAHPALAPLLQGALDAGLLLVQAGQEAALERELTALGLAPAHALRLQEAQDARTPAGSGGPAEYVFPEDTRQKRTLLEQAIEGGRRVRLMYQSETFHGWYGESRPGKTRQEVFTPLGVYRQGSTPYLKAQRLGDGSEETIRIGYVLGIAVE
ncbi:hypothetical protein [Deinococcus sp.]|uniref:hypothetical protein n=1 Tax=Deinococcus sp. TaxID=47478 RepID=UPI003CC5DA8D